MSFKEAINPSQAKAKSSTTQIVFENGMYGIKADYTADFKFPGVVLTPPGKEWDLTGYLGVEVEITNNGEMPADYQLRVDNPEGPKDPSNSAVDSIKAGATKKLAVIFGKDISLLHHVAKARIRDGYPLDPAHISAIYVGGNNSKEKGAFTVKGLRAIKEGAKYLYEDVKNDVKKIVPPPSGDLIDFKEKVDPALMKPNKAKKGNAPTALTIVGNKGAYAIRVDYSTENKYPGAILTPPTGNWDLSGYVGVEAEIANGPAPVDVCLRVDNAGGEGLPWDTGVERFAAGEIKAIKVIFGKNIDHGVVTTGYALDTGYISIINVLAVKPTEKGSFTIKSLRALKADATDIKQ